ncbi:tRNA (cytosine(38)-C(5))-methyltransferase [Cololabis saira]|uniref:tRNA (cytosine(38)-C(5))-methyltransferase n=1 Tax=Cololabis saira TaxID=129043 RepID=UPI002AD53CCD|nr:tRNA (cytosine(38)-C(5))-methyltransferase [Cololabis saira]
MAELRVLELFSGIGGMHFSLRESGVPARVVAAVDINPTANQIYRHNLPDTPLWNKTIEGITLDDFNRLNFNMILMSPPCQPFTRIGLQGDLSDSRTKSFLHILDLLPRLQNRPRFLLLENVKGFETSAARNQLVKTLTGCGYEFLELLASPTCVGIPNSRLRYFLLARSSEVLVQVPPEGQILTLLSCPASTCLSCPGKNRPGQEVPNTHFLFKRETAEELQRKKRQDQDSSVRRILDFLEPEPEQELEPESLLLPQKTLLRYANILDIVQPEARRSSCFTKGYGRYVEGTGSVLQTCLEEEVDRVYSGLDQLPDDQKLQQLQKLKLRYFSPREVSNLMGFPRSFEFPPSVSTLQRYRVLGNSLNVVLVGRLIRFLVSQNPLQVLDGSPVLVPGSGS